MIRLFGGFAVLVLVAGLITGIAYAADLTKGLVGYWPLDGNADEKIAGKVKGALVGGADWVNSGRVKGAVKLDGVNGYVRITGFKLVTDKITFAAWINGWKQTDWAGIVVSRGTSATWMGFGKGDTLTYVWNGDAQNTWGWAGAPAIPRDTWALTAVAIAPDRAISYVYSDADGLKQATNKIPHIAETVDNLKFGWDECEAGKRYFKGIIDEVMIYERALAPDEVLQLATRGLSIAVSEVGKLTTAWGSIKER